MSGRGGAIAIFVKTPGIGRVKTRLAKELGEERATRFHLLSARATAAVVQSFLAHNPFWRGHFAVAERQGVSAACWSEFPPLAPLWCGEGGLGRRMWRVARALRRAQGAAILIGADTPQIRPRLLEAAAAALRNAPWVIGPARDGGFWLLGTRVDLPLRVWEAPDYERRSDRVRIDLVTAAGRAGLPAPVELPMLSDVDRRADFENVLAQWPEHDEEDPEQAELRHWWMKESSAE